MVRSRSWLLLGSVFCFGWVFGLVWAQYALNPARGQAIDDVPVEQRSQLFAYLDQEAAQEERHANILKTVIRLTAPTVVHIEAEKTDSAAARRFGRSRTVQEAGSGVIVQYNNNYYVVTNRHVVKDTSLADITISLSDGRQIHPAKVDADQDTDVAVMRISASNLVAARLGNSDKVEIGDSVLAMGSPFGLSHSVTSGIISQKGRRELELGDDVVKFQDFMQTDAAINPGNSGGPLLNLRGEVIGINTAIASSSGTNEGVGFSIPINMVWVVGRQLIERGSVKRAFLGVNLDPKFTSTAAIELGLPRKQGARITGVTPGSPAEAARLTVNDVILQFDGIRVDNDLHLVNMVSLTEVGREIPLLVLRDHKQIQVMVRVVSRPAFTPPAREE